MPWKALNESNPLLLPDHVVCGRTARKVLVSKPTYDYFEVVAGNDGVSVLHPLDGGSRRAGHLALKDNVHGLVGVNVCRPLDKLRGNCWKETQEEKSVEELS